MSENSFILNLGDNLKLNPYYYFIYSIAQIGQAWIQGAPSVSSCIALTHPISVYVCVCAH